MSAVAWAFLLAAGIAAVADWWSVAVSRRGVEAVAKPAVLVLLIATAVALDPADPAVRWLFVAGLALGLLGDVLLLADRFVPGAAAFLVGHLAYATGLLLVPLSPQWLALGGVLFLVGVATVARRIVAAASRRSAPLAAVVACYVAALGAVVVLGIGTAVPAAAAGAVLFAVSDGLLAWGRFVAPAPGGRTAVHITYHAAQALLVLSLLSLQP